MKKIFLLLALMALVTVSCIKMPKTDPPLPEVETGLKIPDNFDWKTTKEIKVTVGVTAVDALSKEKLHTIKIYNSPLLNSGSLIASGTATSAKPFSVALSVASITDKLYVYEMKSNGLVTVTEKEVTAPSLNINLTNGSSQMPTKSNAFIANNAPPAMTPMPFPTNYDVTITDNSVLKLSGFASGQTSAHGNTYKSYIIPAGITRTVNIDFNNGPGPHSILYVKGTLNLTGVNVVMYYNSLVILDGGTVNVMGLSTSTTVVPMPFLYIEKGGTLNLGMIGGSINLANMVNKGTITSAAAYTVSKDCIVINDGEFTINMANRILTVSENSILYNTGTITTPKFTVTKNSTITNNATGIITTESMNITNGTLIDNYGEIVATSKFWNTDGVSTVNNYCRLIAKETNALNLTANLKQGSLWNTTDKLVAVNSTFNMDGGSMFLTASVSTLTGSPNNMKFISTSPNFALVKNTGNMPTFVGKNCVVSGNIEFVHEKLVDGSGANGKDLYLPSFSGGALLSKVQTKNIPGTTCNLSLGQIEPTTPPIDPNAEFETYFPSQSGWGTYAFEDLWPFKGDYDLNDMVLKFRVTIVSNSANKVKRVIFDYNLIAVGATKTPSVAFQLDNVPAANIGSVTGQILGSGVPFSVAANGTEPGVNLAVIPVFNNPKDVVSFPVFLNTEKNRAHIIAPTNQIVVTLSTPVDQSQITMGTFNLFISTDERGKEIHLPTFATTSKFKASLAMNKSLNANDIFKHVDGMMWGLMFPDAFDYPKENASIINAYTHFAAWATSGGTSYQNWYFNEAGYRNEDLIY